MTKRELIEALENSEIPDDAVVMSVCDHAGITSFWLHAGITTQTQQFVHRPGWGYCTPKQDEENQFTGFAL